MRLPPLNALRAFEAVARCGSILKAAEELGVVRGAVRQQLAALEGHLGVPLFSREGRRLVLTGEGSRLAAAAGTAFGILQRAAADIAAPKGRREIRLGVPAAFAVWWLMPRLPSLETDLAGIDVRVLPLAVVEPLSRHPDLDAVIMGGEYQSVPEVAALRFMEDEFGPVAAPDLSAQLRLRDDRLRLGEAVALIARTAPTLWDDWFVESGTAQVTFPRRSVFEDLLLAIAAARAGSGVTVAPRASIEADLRHGLLAAPYGFIARPGGYRLCFRSADAQNPAIVAFGEWLSGQGAATGQKI
ncbi:transcriptional regulator [Metarhizobium album]|uniref:Transcriptional regulator n=1 Tax=Metarhizobium album TaxID=2182425 RepID=A0A2U2DYI7_9HYPH|nr:LysR family transcriptional regulator [Rhizobium album]PWE58388.1 transcriptional regulator [Rhizobium album]